MIDEAVNDFRKEMARTPKPAPLGEGAAEKRITAKGSRLYDLVAAPVLNRG